MRTNIIQKKIDLSHYKSTFQSGLSYFDENGNVVSASKENPNFGHCVADVILPISVNVQTDVNILLKEGDDYTILQHKSDRLDQELKDIGKGGQSKYIDVSGEFANINDGNKYASFQTLVIWYRFFKRYYDALYTLRCDDELYEFKESDAEYAITPEMKKLYNDLGGDATYKWLKNILEEGGSCATTNCASINIPITISRDIDDIGEYSTLEEPWQAGIQYNKGNYVSYNNDVFVQEGSKSYKFNEEQRYMEFDYSNYKNSYALYIEEESKKEYFNEVKVISGKTESKLNNFVDVKRTHDSLGNDMHGLFIESDAITQPNKDGIQLDLQYHIYNVASLVKTDEPYVFDNEKYYKVFGCILTNIKVYLKDIEGKIIEEQELVWNDNGGNITKIENIINKAEDITDTTSLCDRNAYIEFKYVMGTTLKLSGSKDECHYDIDEESKDDGVFYTDTKIITKEPIVYHSSTDASYIIYYFKLSPSEERIIKNDTLGTVMTYDMSDYYFNLKHETTKDDEESPLLNVPITKLEYKMGTATLQKVESDVYVQRGVSAAFERYALLGGIKTFEALSNYQNSNLKIINNSEQS